MNSEYKIVEAANFKKSPRVSWLLLRIIVWLVLLAAVPLMGYDIFSPIFYRWGLNDIISHIKSGSIYWFFFAPLNAIAWFLILIGYPAIQLEMRHGNRYTKLRFLCDSLVFLYILTAIAAWIIVVYSMH